jgi:hypothetical protein
MMLDLIKSLQEVVTEPKTMSPIDCDLRNIEDMSDFGYHIAGMWS